ncbi:MAG: flagellar basal-body rod protein FlgG [Gammaproteobacteria bacterium]|nr:flagellar basal-body rod protein FlgG [Gammaproteobacteria bacterium]PCH62675.1 MAG: flagellar basal-body rod protein FlgG [Gammaproteobacteria bacterium]
MNSALFAAKTGLDAQQTRVAVIANNLANVSTTGFKRDRVVFEDLLYQNVRQVGAASSQNTLLPSGLNIGTGVRVVATEKLHTQGSISITDNPLNVAIQGRGFLQTLLPDGSLGYTRDGSLQIDAEGQLVNSSGFPIQPAINIPAASLSISIGSDGTVSAQISGQAAPTQVGNLQLVDFVNPSGLQPNGDNLFLESASSGAPQAGTPGLNGLGSLVQGAVESSNVNVVEELVSMIEAQRAYELNSKTIETVDQMLQFASNNL